MYLSYKNGTLQLRSCILSTSQQTFLRRYKKARNKYQISHAKFYNTRILKYIVASLGTISEMSLCLTLRLNCEKGCSYNAVCNQIIEKAQLECHSYNNNSNNNNNNNNNNDNAQLSLNFIKRILLYFPKPLLEHQWYIPNSGWTIHHTNGGHHPPFPQYSFAVP
jgi:hypothetical protein